MSTCECDWRHALGAERMPDEALFWKARAVGIVIATRVGNGDGQGCWKVDRGGVGERRLRDEEKEDAAEAEGTKRKSAENALLCKP